MKNMPNLEKLRNFKAWNPSAAQLAVAMKRSHEPADTFTRKQHVIIWICSFVAAGTMVETLFFKFTGAPESKHIFSKMGTEPWMRWVQGIWELRASIGLLWPRMRWAGGILTVGAMAAAILSHLTWLGLSVQGDDGLLFGMAIVTFTGGFTVMMLHRHSIPNYESLSRW